MLSHDNRIFNSLTIRKKVFKKPVFKSESNGENNEANDRNLMVRCDSVIEIYSFAYVAKLLGGRKFGGAMSSRRNVNATKGPSGEMSSDEMTCCELSGGEISDCEKS